MAQKKYKDDWGTGSREGYEDRGAFRPPRAPAREIDVREGHQAMTRITRASMMVISWPRAAAAEVTIAARF